MITLSISKRKNSITGLKESLNLSMTLIFLISIFSCPLEIQSDINISWINWLVLRRISSSQGKLVLVSPLLLLITSVSLNSISTPTL